MTMHMVRQGECLISIARRYGFASWHKIYDHPENASLRERRPNPNILLAGDRVFIPELIPGTEEAVTKRRNRFRLTRKPVKVRLVIEDKETGPLAGLPYELSVGLRTFQGTTGDDGLVEEIVDPLETRGFLTVWMTESRSGGTLSFPIQIGHLDPIDEVSGIQARLNQIGFPCGRVDGRLGPRTSAALRAFQQTQGLDPADGTPNPETKRRLQNEVGA